MGGKKDRKVGDPGDHFPKLLTNLSSLQSKERFCEVVFLCRGGQVSAHKAMMGPLSPLLSKLFEISRQFQVTLLSLLSSFSLHNDMTLSFMNLRLLTQSSSLYQLWMTSS